MGAAGQIMLLSTPMQLVPFGTQTPSVSPVNTPFVSMSRSVHASKTGKGKKDADPCFPSLRETKVIATLRDGLEDLAA